MAQQILDPIVSLLNDEIAREQAASLTYKALAVWADMAGHDGAAAFFNASSAEEIDHRDGFMQYLADMDARPVVPSVGPNAIPDGLTLKGAIDAALALEIEVRRAIQSIYSKCAQIGDHMTAQFLLDYLAEQHKAIAELLRIQRWFVAYGTDGAALERIDHKIKKLV